MESIKKEYEILKKKYNLPDFDILDSELEISSIDNSHFLLRKIRKKIEENVESFCKILEEILQPETSLSGLHECRFFNEDQKKEIYELYKKLMVINRNSLQLLINNIEKDDADFIINVFKQWDNIKKDLSKWVSMLKENWEKETDVKEDLGYFG